MKYEKNTAAELAAVNEETITPIQLLQEIEPLLKEYFIGDFEIKDNCIRMSFKNGDIYNLTIGGVVKTKV